MRDRGLVVGDVPMPVPGAGEVLVRTLACGICGSDLHALRFADQFVETSRRAGNPFVMDLSRDVVMGHEFCAEIVEHGPETRRTLPVGTRVCSRPMLLRATGPQTIGYSNDNPGGYGEYMRLTEALLLPVPNGLSTDHAALTEPMAVGIHAVAKARLQPDDAPLVIGCGPVGLAVIAALRLAGARPIVAADFSARRRELAVQFGADVVVDPAATTPWQSWREAAVYRDPSRAPALPPWIAGPAVRPAVVFECVGVPGILDQVMAAAPRGSRIVVVGVCMEADTIHPMLGIGKELNLQFVLGYTPEEFASTLGHLADGAIPAAPIITGTVGIDGVNGAFVGGRGGRPPPPPPTPRSWSNPRSQSHILRAHLLFTFTSSYGPDQAKPAMRPMLDSSTRGPRPDSPAFSQIGATIAFSCMSCWIRCRVASRRFGSSSLACSRKRPSMSP
jgi:threonine dehydrogenase-like Zn-dependent dehydrogenase